MKDIYPVALLIGGITLIGICQAFAGLLLLWLSWYTYSEGKE